MSRSTSSVAVTCPRILNVGPTERILIKKTMGEVGMRQHQKAAYPGKSRPGMPISNNVICPESTSPCWSRGEEQFVY